MLLENTRPQPRPPYPHSVIPSTTEVGVGKPAEEGSAQWLLGAGDRALTAQGPRIPLWGDVNVLKVTVVVEVAAHLLSGEEGGMT